MVAAMTTISVTAEHIAKGRPGDCRFCPVALAVEDAFPGTNCWVARDTLTLYSNGRQRLRVPHPGTVLKFIRAFDSADPVEPFTFELDYPAVAA
jgi:hypothetical protein